MADFDALVKNLDEIDTVTIVTTRKDGTAVATYIWSVVVNGVPYVRSAYGPGSWWYRRALSRPLIAFDVGAADGHGRTPPPPSNFTDLAHGRTEHVPDDVTNADVHAAIDEALHTKYRDEPKSLAYMITPEARACTLQVLTV